APESDEHGVYGITVLDEFESNRPGAFTGIKVFAVLNQKRAFAVSHLPREMASIIKVAVDNPHGCARSADPFQLIRVRGGASHDRYGNPAALSAVGQRQPKVADARTNGRLGTAVVGQPRHDCLSAARLKTPDRIGGFEFHNELAIQHLAERWARVLRRVSEDRRNSGDCGSNSV